MKDKNRLWVIFTRKLCGEASAKEMAELEVLLKSNPDQSYRIEVIDEWWKLNHPKKKAFEEAEVLPQMSARLERMMNDGMK